jgi:uncharacterized spore protein YtfJ
MADATGEGELRQYLPQTSFLERLADRLELGSNARAVFAAPVERDGTTVIPVAKAKWAMGGGWGTRRDVSEVPPRHAGTGGGGATMVKPLGFIELANGKAKFRPIRDPALTALTTIAAGILGICGLAIALAPGSMEARPLPRLARQGRLMRLRRFFK